MHQNHLDQSTEPQRLTIENDQLMSSAQKRFYISPQCDIAREQLQALVDNNQYDTRSPYYATSSLSFIERHLYYLSQHPTLELNGYISNLKLMTRIRSS